ncbi:MAG: radical SAM protein, partial [Flavobacterium sp.]
LGGKPFIEFFTKSKKGNSWEMMSLNFHDKKESFSIQVNKNEGEWLTEILKKISVSNSKTYSFNELKTDFETSLEDFELFWYSKPIHILRDFGLLVL